MTTPLDKMVAFIRFASFCMWSILWSRTVSIQASEALSINLLPKDLLSSWHEPNKKRTILKWQDEHMTRKEELRGLKSLHMTKKHADQKLLTPQEGDDFDIQSTLSVQSQKKFNQWAWEETWTNNAGTEVLTSNHASKFQLLQN